MSSCLTSDDVRQYVEVISVIQLLYLLLFNLFETLIASHLLTLHMWLLVFHVIIA